MATRLLAVKFHIKLRSIIVVYFQHFQAALTETECDGRQ